MATIDKTGGVLGIPVDGLNRHYILENIIDFSKDSLLATQTLAVFRVPANTLVRQVFMNVLVADAGCDACDVGVEGATTNGFYGAANLTTTGWKRDIDQAYAEPTGFLSASDAYIIVGSATDPIALGKVKFLAQCVDLG